MKFKKYRVVRDDYAGFEVQYRKIWFPFWIQACINTHSSLEKAIKYIETLKSPVLYTE